MKEISEQQCCILCQSASEDFGSPCPSGLPSFETTVSPDPNSITEIAKRARGFILVKEDDLNIVIDENGQRQWRSEIMKHSI